MELITITPKNRAAIESALAKANGTGASEHTYSTYEDIETLATRAENEALAMLHAPELLPGAGYCSISGQPSTSGRMRRATRAIILRSEVGWHLAYVAPATIHGEVPTGRLNLPEIDFSNPAFA